MFFAVPSTMRIAASTLMQFKSGIFSSAISCRKQFRYAMAGAHFQRTLLPNVKFGTELIRPNRQLQNGSLRTFSCAVVSDPTFCVLGAPEPLGMPAALRIRNDAGGVLRMNVKLLSCAQLPRIT